MSVERHVLLQPEVAKPWGDLAEFYLDALGFAHAFIELTCPISGNNSPS